jgi:O-antigen/teichoic acid export membrane protein
MILKNLLSMSGMNILKSGLQFAMTVMMTYFVGPSEFGLVTFSLPFVGFIALLTDLGMSSAMVQRETLDEEDAGAAITLICAIGLVCAAILALIATPLAGVLKMDGLAAVLATLSLSVVLSIAALGPRAILERELRYQTVASVEVVAVIVAVAACVGAAFAGWGVWALITYYLVVQVVRATAFATIARHDVRLNFQWKRVSSILSFGGWVLASNLLNFAGRAVGNLLIGAAVGAAAVGLYGLAYQVMILPLMVITWPGSGVLMATLSRQSATGSVQQRNEIIYGVISLTAAVVFPGMAYFTFGADYLFTTFFPAKWAGIIPLISLMTIAGAAQSITAYSGAMLLSKGHAQLQFWLSAANSLSTIVAFFVGLPFGLLGIIKIYLAVTLIVSLATMWITCRRTGLPVLELGRALLPATAAAVSGVLIATQVMNVMTDLGDSRGKAWLLATGVYIVLVVLSYVLFHRQLAKNLLGLRDLRLNDREVAAAA